MSQPSTSAGRPAGFLTLKYGGAVVSALVGLFAAMGALPMLFQLWTGSGYSASSPVADVLAKLGLGGNNGVVLLAVAAVVFSLLAFLLYRRATKDIALRPDYVNSTPYVFITNAFVGVVAFVVAVYVVDLLTVLISSLLLIGKGNIGGMYLNQFLPNLLAAGLAVFAGLMGYKIAKGKNMSFVMTLVTLCVAGAILVAACITVPIKGYTSGSTAGTDWKVLQEYNSSNSTSDYKYNNRSFDSYFDN